MGIGTLDTTFSLDGKLEQDLSADDTAVGVVAQGDGKIVTVGITRGETTDFYLRRYNKDGSDDTQFNTNAKTTTPSLGPNVRSAVAIAQKDGFFYVVGQTASDANSSFDIFVARYRSDGSLDTIFGGGSGTPAGFSFSGTAVDDESSSSLVVQGDGKIVISGSIFNESTQSKDLLIVRFNSNGSLDTTFGSNGRVVTDIGANDKALGVRLQKVGIEERIVITGSTGFSGSEDIILVRYLSTGALDTAFGTGGKVQTSFGSGSDIGSDLVILPDNKIFVVGETNSGSSGKADFAIVRYNSDGQLDLSFGQTGKTTINTSSSTSGGDGALKVKLDSKGKILILGYADSATAGVDATLVRLNSDGVVDTGFGTLGVLLTSIGSGASQDNPFSIDVNLNDNSIAIAGGVKDSSNAVNSFIAKYRGDSNKASLGPDFNGDSNRDLIWRNTNTGLALTWFLDGTSYVSEANFPNTVTDQNWQIVSANDFNKDGKDDLFWRNSVTGQNLVWFMNGTNKIGERSINGAGVDRLLPGNDWQIKATADFNRDGDLDILWRNSVTGNNVVWNLGGSDGTTYQSESSIGPAFTGGWDIRAANDFNLDGNTDIIWRNSISGANLIWYLGGATGTNYQSEQSLISVANSNWNIVGSGDFNKDGEADLLWRNSSTGQNQVWTLGGPTNRAFLNVATVTAEWKIQATGDFNGDGREDLVWRNSNSGVALTWFMNGNNYIGESNFPNTVTDQNWQIVSANDFDKDGKDDLFWRNSVTGKNLVWFMNGANKIGERAINSEGSDRLVPGNDWQIKATADFNKDGNVDILWRNSVTGNNLVWNLGGADGTTYQSESSVGPAFTNGWDIRAAADFNLDGSVDLVWRNLSSGLDLIWYLGGTNGTTYQSEQAILSVGDSNWNIVGSGDFNQDGEADLLWRNSVSGQNQIWALGGTANRSFLNTPTVSPEWKLL
jgi:uncharacterized delta-60 repeat protein